MRIHNVYYIHFYILYIYTYIVAFRRFGSIHYKQLQTLYIYTEQLLNLLEIYSLKQTFLGNFVGKSSFIVHVVPVMIFVRYTQTFKVQTQFN